MRERSTVILFIDDDPKPFGEFEAPLNFELDTTKLIDGDHTLTIVGKSPDGKEGIKKIPFTVRNGPAINIEGLKPNAVAEGVIPVMINAYGNGDQSKFLVEGCETPRSVPSLVFAAIIFFFGWAAYYIITSLEK